ncbi:hypothetical protein ACFQE5_22245 [Pseudonocardia hispaniensis]|uniref:Uncharacterized protein n=1 Tax=Pseudonocardia hispaniensis TaxID=904933 RepID=A0ABW1J9B1_9PSEU
MTTQPAEPDLAGMLPTGWHTTTCHRCGQHIEHTSTDPALVRVGDAVHRLGHEVTVHDPTDPLPALPTDVHTVRLLDHHGQLIEVMPAHVYEQMRGPANAARKALRQQLGEIT